MSKLNILVAYPYCKPDVISTLGQNKDHIRFVLDSGAFTAWKAGKPIKLDDYCRFIESLPFEPWKYFALDVIGDPHATMKNYEIMLLRGFKPIPIFTRGEDPSVLNDYYKTSDVVGIGGLVGTPGNKGFVKGIMKYVGARKVHWLGFTSQDFVTYFKPYMCDSSSWTSSYRYGSAKIYVGNGEWLPFTRTSVKKKQNSDLILAVKNLKIDPSKILDDSQWSNKKSLGLAVQNIVARSWVKYQSDLQTKLNVNFFLACCLDKEIKLLCNAVKFWKENGVIK